MNNAIQFPTEEVDWSEVGTTGQAHDNYPSANTLSRYDWLRSFLIGLLSCQSSTTAPTQFRTGTPWFDLADNTLKVNIAGTWHPFADAIAVSGGSLTDLGTAVSALQASIAGKLNTSGGTITGNLSVNGITSLDNGAIATDGEGGLIVDIFVNVPTISNNDQGVTINDGTGLIVVGGTTSLDDGAFTTDGEGNIQFNNSLTSGSTGMGIQNGNSYSSISIGDPGAVANDTLLTIDSSLSVFTFANGSINADNGALTTDGNGDMTVAGISVAGNSYPDGLLVVNTDAGYLNIGDWNSDRNGVALVVDDNNGVIQFSGRDGTQLIVDNSLRFSLTPNGSTPSTQTSGQFWNDNGILKFYNGTAWKTVTLT